MLVLTGQAQGVPGTGVANDIYVWSPHGLLIASIPFTSLWGHVTVLE